MLLNTLIKRFQPRHYTPLHIEFPLHTGQHPTRGLNDSEYIQAFSDEIESKVLAIHTVLVNNHGIKPKCLRGTIVPDTNAHPTPRNKIIVTCRVPEDAPITMIRSALTQMFGEN